MKRSRLEICYDVLQSVGNGADAPTKMVYRANVSWVMLQDILNVLLTSDYIALKDSEGRRTFRLTDKGQEVLKRFESVSKDFEPIINSARKNVLLA